MENNPTEIVLHPLEHCWTMSNMRRSAMDFEFDAVAPQLGASTLAAGQEQGPIRYDPHHAPAPHRHRHRLSH
ncbi:hypothetical protein SNOG_13187 [Parastagonospora nodorum SN15]|uniref:Uncharacterized protein n=1 Tax=Phaeosphaeria nodorum (strain SN15 / ATCC MYA-4574 / FGSC 10173) TaxID=321614 RepID=Q0U4X7_PHANO|nr:hypothetical protein SNOG_13187 [Parastagonospora nodorum SN15]EAT79514.1 hypothetical protein SNOG_13187 [Parastagonospora nodorum SN15]